MIDIEVQDEGAQGFRSALFYDSEDQFSSEKCSNFCNQRKASWNVAILHLIAFSGEMGIPYDRYK